MCYSHLSVCLSVTSRCSTETAERIGSRKQCHTIGQGFWFSGAKDLGKTQNVVTPIEASNAGGVG